MGRALLRLRRLRSVVPRLAPGVIKRHPEVSRLVLGGPEAYWKAAEDAMRAAGFSGEETVAARRMTRGDKTP